MCLEVKIWPEKICLGILRLILNQKLPEIVHFEGIFSPKQPFDAYIACTSPIIAHFYDWGHRICCLRHIKGGFAV